MKHTKKYISVLCAVLALSLVFSGCGTQKPSESSEPSEAMTESAPETTGEATVPETTGVPVPETTEAPVPETTEAPAPDTTLAQPDTTIYIGTKNRGFTAIPVVLKDGRSPEALIEAIAEETGWDLTLADTVSTGKGGMSVDFSTDSSLITGPGMDQKEEYYTYDITSTVIMILDSIQETLQRNYVMEPGDPKNLDIYFSLEGGDIDLPGAGIFYPFYEPWDSDQCMK